MTMRQKVCGKKYFIYAKRKDSGGWSGWAQTSGFDEALTHFGKIVDLGFLAKVLDKEENKVIICSE